VRARRRSAVRPPARAALLIAALAAFGCAALGPVPFDVAPGQRAVLGRVDLGGFEVPEGVLEIVKEDRSFDYALPIRLGQRDFAISLPPGRYRVLGLRATKDRDSTPNDNVWPLRLTFEVGPEPAVYIGTLRLASRFGRDVRVSIVDEYDDTVRVLSRFYTGLPEPVAHRLLQPA
jgi:hypothetical protein